MIRWHLGKHQAEYRPERAAEQSDQPCGFCDPHDPEPQGHDPNKADRYLDGARRRFHRAAGHAVHGAVKCGDDEGGGHETEPDVVQHAVMLAQPTIGCRAYACPAEFSTCRLRKQADRQVQCERHDHRVVDERQQRMHGTSRRISLVSTEMSEVWKHMPIVKAKYAKSMSAGGPFPGKWRQLASLGRRGSP